MPESELDNWFGKPEVVSPKEAPEHGRLDRSLARDYLLAGQAVVTFLNTESGTRFTYKVSAHKDGEPWFVRVRTGGGEFEDTWAFIGTIFGDSQFRMSRKSTLHSQSPSVLAFTWIWRHIDVLPTKIEVWHEGHCMKCGRSLSDPESIARGLGPVCAGTWR